MDMKLNLAEKELVGQWIMKNGKVRRDAVCERIEWLIAHQLKEIAISKQWGTWETLFQDPDDGRYWERTYLQGDSHGGGPPSLRVLSSEQAKAKYQTV